MKTIDIARILAILPLAFATAMRTCRLGTNKCDATNASVMLCGSQGWKTIETCYKAGACHVGPAGNAYCDKQVECTPDESQCDAANYVSRICNREGFWETDRKCAKPGCCEVRDGKAICQTECGAGLRPPRTHSALGVTREYPQVGDRCRDDGGRYCDSTHDCILKCGSNEAFFLEQCCEGRSCYYDNASLEPFCA